MEAEAYQEMAQTESEHWWFVARRQILDRLLRRLALPVTPRILEIGAGTGGNLAMLGRLGHLDAVERDETARNLAEKKTGVVVHAGALPDHLPLERDSYDLICMFDVLEHIADDRAALVAVRKLLKPNGRLVLTVPAYRWLWSSHDTQLHHHRRYTRAGLRRLAGETGFICNRISYFNTLLLPLLILTRLANALFKGRSAIGTAVPAPPLNALLRKIFGSERFLLPYVDFPAGASLYVELR
jgi:SAM-dependent methyltransferase